MIESARFVNVNGARIDLNTNDIPFNNFSTEVDTRMTEREKSMQHGLYPSNTFLGKRLYHFDGDILAQSSAGYWQRRMAMIAALLPRPHLGYKQAGTLYLLFTGMGEEFQADCTIDGWPELPLTGRSPSNGAYQINFKSFDPRLYGVLNAVDLAYGVNENIGGRTYNKTYNVTYSGGVGIPSAIITNSGIIETFLTVTMYGPVVSPKLTFQRSDGVIQYMTLNGLNLSNATDYVTVDFLRRTAITNTGANVYNTTVGSDWFAIEPLPMTQTLRYSSASGSSPAHALVQWRNAYMI